jgi:hypothetical protein
MKTIFAIFGLGLSLAAHAEVTTWANFETGNDLLLKSDLVVNESLTIKAGTEFFIDEASTLDPVPVMTFSGHFVPCAADIDVGTIEMTMIDHNNYGIEYAQSCKATLYVEFRDLSKESLFTRAQ